MSIETFFCMSYEIEMRERERERDRERERERGGDIFHCTHDTRMSLQITDTAFYELLLNRHDTQLIYKCKF